MRHLAEKKSGQGKGRRRRRQYVGLAFVFPGFVGVLIFYMIPFMDVLRRSVFNAMGNEFRGLENYRKVLSNEAFLLAAANTLRFLAVCLPLLLPLSFLVAMLLQQMSADRKAGRSREKLISFLKSAYLFPMAIPVASVVLLWKLVFDKYGMLNGVLAAFHLPECDWMNTGAAFGVLVFSYIWKNLGYDMVLWLAGLSSVPENIYEAARVDGAGNWACFFRITLPCMKPVIFMIVVISLLNTFKVFREAWLVAGSYPQESIYLLQHLFNNWFRDLSVDKMAAGAVLLSGVIFLLVWLLQKCWERVE